MRLRLGLTAEQIAARRQGIGGSDAGRIMSGDWMPLWLEKTGRADAEDLSGVLPVCIGSFTEPLNLHWLEQTTGRLCSSEGKVVISEKYPWMRCTLDALTDYGTTVVQCKHVNALAKIEEVVAKYLPQISHEMIVCGLKRAVLSVFIGTWTHQAVDIELDDFFACQLIDAERKFWRLVETDTPPDGPVEPIAPPKIETWREADMTGRNDWADAAGRWLENRDAAKAFDLATKDLKSLVEPDVRLAHAYGVKVARSKSGALTVKEC